jgi:hypothetical protein
MIPKVFIHYGTFDALCNRVVESGKEGRGVVFSAVSMRLFITKAYHVYAGNWYDVRASYRRSDDKSVSLIGNPFTEDMKFKSHLCNLWIPDFLYTRGLDGDAISLLEDRALFEIEIVPDDVPEDVASVREV